MSTPESIGEFFRQVRETKGLSLDDVASKTRIHPDFLIALEESNFAKLPDQVFAKGFVRSYARSLGLDEEEAMRRFVESAGSFYDKQAERELLRQKQAEDDRRKRANRKAVIAGLGVALLGLVLLLSREQGSTPPARTSVDAPVPPLPVKPAPRETVAPILPAPPAKPDAPPASVPSSSSNTPAVMPVPTAPPERPTDREVLAPLPPVPADPLGLPTAGAVGGDGALTLDLEATELSWVVVQVDGGSPQEALMRPGERVQWKGSDRFLVTLGNAGGVRVELNGKVQGPFGPSGKVARDILIKKPRSD